MKKSLLMTTAMFALLSVTNVYADTLAEAIQNPNIEEYQLLSDFTFNADAGTLNGSDRTLVILGNNHSLIGTGYNGLNIASGQILAINNVRSITGFNDRALTNHGVLEITNSNIYNNGNPDIENTATLNFEGQNNIGNVTNNGTQYGETRIKNGTTTINELKQKEVKVYENATLNVDRMDVDKFNFNNPNATINARSIHKMELKVSI